MQPGGLTCPVSVLFARCIRDSHLGVGKVRYQFHEGMYDNWLTSGRGLFRCCRMKHFILPRKPTAETKMSILYSEYITN